MDCHEGELVTRKNLTVYEPDHVLIDGRVRPGIDGRARMVRHFNSDGDLPKQVM